MRTASRPVSPSYSEEIKTSEFGCGLEVILRMESGKLKRHFEWN